MRAIDADALKKRLLDYFSYSMQLCAEVSDLIDTAPTIEPEPQWIPCSERLPEVTVLCCDTRGEMIIGYPYQDEESNT